MNFFRLFWECKATVTLFVLPVSAVYAWSRTYDCSEHCNSFAYLSFLCSRFGEKKEQKTEFIAFLRSFCFSLIPCEENFRYPFLGESSSNAFLRVKSLYFGKAYGKYVRLKNKSQFSLTPRLTFRFYYFLKFLRILC